MSQQKFLFDIFVTAIEGGVNYWCIVHKYHWRKKDSTEDRERFYAEVEEDDGTSHRITKKTVEAGLKKIVAGEVKISNGLFKDIALGNKELDAGYLDVASADCIIQVGLFGEIVYG